jgi:hypothetical protein
MDLNELSKNPEQIKVLIDMLQSLLPQDKPTEESSSPRSQESSFMKTRRKNAFTEHKNKFIDMPEKDMHKEDSTVDKRLCVSPPVARSRGFTPVKVTCRVCGKTETVNPSIVYDLRENRYKCNSCSTSSG